MPIVIYMNEITININEVVTKILDIEKKANEKVENEKNKLLSIEEEVQKICLEKSKGMEEKENLRIEKIRQLEKDDEEAKINQLEEDFSKSINQLTNAINGNKEKLVLEIFDKIISN